MNLLIIATFTIVIFSLRPPLWPQRFQSNFVQSYFTTNFRDFGTIWYDAERNLMRIDRISGKLDIFCNSMVTIQTPCTQLDRDGKRFISYPLLRQCCYCCDSSHGCAPPPRDWLKNAKYIGTEDISGESFNKFVDKQITYWATTDIQQIPRKLVQNIGIFNDFLVTTYSEGPINDSIFSLPTYCSQSNICESEKCSRLRR